MASTAVSLPEGMSLNPSTGVVSAAQVNGVGGYAVTVQVDDSATPAASATAELNFGVNSDATFGGCQMFPADSVYNQRIDALPVDSDPSHRIPAAYLDQPIHPDFGHGFYPPPGGISFLMVPANQPLVPVRVQGSGQLDPTGLYAWPFPGWPNAPVEGTSYGAGDQDHHILILQSSTNSIRGPQTGPCTLYETYSNAAVPSMWDAASGSWLLGAAAHYVLNSNEIAASETVLDNGAQDSAGIPVAPLLVRYSEVPLGIKHPLRMTFPSPTNWFVWPATGCCAGSGPPQGLLYRLKAGVNWQAVCPVSTNPQAATVLLALQQYGAYMSDHGRAGFITGMGDVRWDDDDLACMKNFHVSDLEVVDNSALEISDLSGQTKPFIAPAQLPDGAVGMPYTAAIPMTGGNPATRSVSVTVGMLPPGLALNPASGAIAGTPVAPGGSLYVFSASVRDSATGYSAGPLQYSIKVLGTGEALPDLNIAKTHSGNFRQGQTGAVYTITVGNNGLLASSGPVTVTDKLPAGLTLDSIAGGGWTCQKATASCTRSDALASGAAYPAITVTVDVAANAPASVLNTATVSGGGETNTVNDSAADLTTVTSAQYRITTASAPTATQYQSYTTTLSASGGTPPYVWSVDSSTGVALPEGMSLDPATGVVSASRVTGQGGYAVTVQATDHGTPSPSTVSATINFGVNSDSSFGGCQMFPPDSIYNQRADQLPVDTNAAHQIPQAYLGSPIHPDFGRGFYPQAGGIPFTRVPANQPALPVRLEFSGQMDGAGVYPWPFPLWPNAAVETGSYGADGVDHHILVLQASGNSIDGPQPGPCTLYETYDNAAVASMFNLANNTWTTAAGVHYLLNSNEIAASDDLLDNGAQDSAGIPIVPLLVRYSEVPMGIRHPLRITFPSPTNWYVWPATGCCKGSGPPQGLLYRLKAGVNWQAVCPVSTNPQAATVLQALQQYGAYMSDHGGAGFISGAGDVRWDDDDLACMKNFHVGDLEVVDNTPLHVSDLSGQSMPYVVPASLPAALAGNPYSATLAEVGGNPAVVRWSVASGTLPPGLALDPATGKIAGTPASAAGSPYSFAVAATDTASGLASAPLTFSIAVAGAAVPVVAQVTNSASFAVGAIAPGELVTIVGFGLGPAGTRVTIGGLAAAILYASATQINCFVPWEIAGQSHAAVQVQTASGSASVTVSVVASAPGIFTANASGSGQAVALNQDGSANSASNPAGAGSTVTVYFTGGGVRGAVQNVTAMVGGVAAAAVSAGAAPGLPDGVEQAQIQLPAGVTGNAVPVVIAAGGYGSTAAATLAIR